MSRQQIKFVFQIGYNHDNATESTTFQEDVIKGACCASGGCTSAIKDGWWCPDGGQRHYRFNTKAEREICFEVELTCEPAKAEGAYEHMKAIISLAAEYHGIDTNWVHVTETVMTGRHFSVKDQLAAYAA